jgi:thiamine kinase-like enzyme
MTKKDIDNADDYYNLIRELIDKRFIAKKAYEHIVRTIKYSFHEKSIESLCEKIEETINELKDKWDKFETKVAEYEVKLNELQNYLDDVDEEILS